MGEEIEIWKTIPELKNYSSSNFGRIKNHKTDKVLTPHLNRGRDFNISIGGRTMKVHQLVAFAFLQIVEGKTHVDHIDGNPKNNKVENLRWCTHAENIKFGWETGCYNNLGSRHGMSKLNEDQVAEIKKLINYGEKNYIIAKSFKVKQSTICDIRKGRTWAHL